MRLCPIKTMTALLAVTALLTLDSDALSVVLGLLPIAVVAAVALGGDDAALTRAIRWLRRRLRRARPATQIVGPAASTVRCPNGLALPALATRGPPA